ncbi:YisL family protein [Bacillus tuaregi]|uniref:YisL family protein n=1 Tax=Bacillus tuaregi TaxID=1816695 RepID=UPI0008F8388B|nr:YisL family protein [Bacillus tuaregi]
MTHAHITTWVLALILFFIAISLHKSGKQRGLKIVQMILRLFYLFIIATGVMMLVDMTAISTMHWIKAILGIIVIGFFEMVLASTIKGKSTGAAWLLFVIAFVAVVYLGLSLPLGFYI